MLRDLHSPFSSYLDERRQHYEEKIREAGFPEIISEESDISRVERLILAGAGDDLNDVQYYIAPSLPTIYEALGFLKKALTLYKLGVYAWPHPWSKDPTGRGPKSLFGGQGSLQLEAAICAGRIGQTGKAHELYEWAVENHTLTPEEIDGYSSDGEYQIVWERYPYRAYALVCLERWEEALEVARETQNLVDQDERAQTSQSYRKEFRLLRVVTALASYEIDPSDENRHKAQEMLHPQAVASFDHAEHMWGLFYLYNLRARHPELANPPEAETPQAERARQGAEACKQIMAGFGVSLDDTVESLEALDRRIRDLYRMAQSDEEKERQIFVWGCYFGEVVGAELAGGRWRISQDNLLDSTLTWTIGGDELDLEAFKIVHDYVTGQSEKSLHQAWLEAEDSYVEYAMAARYSD